MNTGDDPVEHDPWLREALRHAPDGDAGPPPRLDDHILRMGRAAVAPRPTPAPAAAPGLAARLLAAWDWLARPPVAAGLASVLLASVVGVMWWGRPLQDTLPPREAPMADTHATTDDGAAGRSAPAAALPAPSAPAPTIAAAPAQPPKPAPPATTPARKLAAPEPPPAAVAPPPPAAPPAPPPAAPAPPPAPAAAADRSAAKAAEGVGALRGAPERREMASPSASALAEAAPAPAADAQRQRAAAGSIETPGLSNLRFEIRPRPQAWSWQRDDGPAQPVNDALQNWIALADRSARPHWNPGTAGGDGATATLRFTRDGTLRATLHVGPKGLRLDRAGKSESAELTAAQARTLLDALATLGP